MLPHELAIPESARSVLCPTGRGSGQEESEVGRCAVRAAGVDRIGPADVTTRELPPTCLRLVTPAERDAGGAFLSTLGAGFGFLTAFAFAAGWVDWLAAWLVRGVW